MRLESNGIFFVFIILAICGSFIALLFTVSRCARDLYTIHEKTTVSPVLVSLRLETISHCSFLDRRRRIRETRAHHVSARPWRLLTPFGDKLPGSFLEQAGRIHRHISSEFLPRLSICVRGHLRGYSFLLLFENSAAKCVSFDVMIFLP
jgi:hypothetical protein